MAPASATPAETTTAYLESGGSERGRYEQGRRGSVFSLFLTVPPTFTRCMDVVLGHMWQQGLRILNYLDDWLICAQTQEQCHHDVLVLLAHIWSLGLCINTEKCRLQLAQTTQFLGMGSDTRAFTCL